jgi:hypothetical protein
LIVSALTAARWKIVVRISGQQPGPAGELQGEPLVRIIEVDSEQVGDAPQPVGHGVAVQMQYLRRPDDRALLV